MIDAIPLLFFFVSSLYILSIQSHILSALDGNASCLPIPFFIFFIFTLCPFFNSAFFFYLLFFLYIPVSIFIQCPFLSFHLLLSPSFNYPHFRFHLMPVSLIPPSPFFNSTFFFYLHIFFFWFMPISIFIQCLFCLLLPSSFTYPHFCFNLMPISLIPPSFTVLTYYYFFLFPFFISI